MGVVAAATALLNSIGTPTANGQSSEKTLNYHIEESLRTTRRSGPSAGSLFSSRSFLAELGRDPKAASVGDLVTIQVVEQAQRAQQRSNVVVPELLLEPFRHVAARRP